MQYISPLSSPLLKTSPRRLCLLGSTGSIGISALRVVEKNPEFFTVNALAGAKNCTRLAQQALRFRPPFLAVLTEVERETLKTLLPKDYTPKILVGEQGYIDLACHNETDVVLAAQVGAAGLIPAMAAAQKGKMLCLANKESLVLAGDLFRQVCHQSGAVLLPVDSEHNALFQALAGHNLAEVQRLILTASGGPFRSMSLQSIKNASPEAALQHPNWSMGQKISIDSATMMNKGLEIIEAVHLYGAKPVEIDVVVHPESIVHSLVEYKDGSQLAQLGLPDMEIPIGYCLAYPQRSHTALPPLRLAEIGRLTFEQPDEERFPCLRLAREALDAGASHCIVLNAANEIAVQAFLDKKLSFFGISEMLSTMLDKHSPLSIQNLDDIVGLDGLVRQKALELLPDT